VAQLEARGRQEVPQRRDRQVAHVSRHQRLVVDPLRQGLQLRQKRGGGLRRVVQAVGAVGEALVQLPLGLLAELVDLQDHRVGQGVAHLEHVQHEQGTADRRRHRVPRGHLVPGGQGAQPPQEQAPTIAADIAGALSRTGWKYWPGNTAPENISTRPSGGGGGLSDRRLAPRGRSCTPQAASVL